MSNEVTEIENLLDDYAKSLNDGDAKAARAVYARDGVFYPYNLPTSKGEQLEATYQDIFDTIQLGVKFNIHEIAVAGEFAYAVTDSRGTVKVKSIDASVPEENREVFILRKENSEWKIAHYLFNKPAAPPVPGA
ncbi:DUF4440 domain-containing protein [Mycobacterium sp. CBMA271]|uniref:YybH family protein n=1 Tax=unclassified Mycobacteroides TaxID=2618759 RepID=UPI0012DEB39D|nr:MULTISPECIES: nuclear transport factor 2 family protein [unclassified Mycobacteroides]MUM18875.1 hypothetical protein [Mycobacteroides sp. CBMA 326]MUM23185.1 DUF4440 domain-containing protein [Mycobacteroides sp. CBMA 271]